MVSNNKRMKYAYENEITTSEEESCEDTDYMPNNKVSRRQTRNSKYSSKLPDFQNEFSNKKYNPRARGRKPKCFTKNALLARENRLKKKIYIENLENNVASLRNENVKLTTVVDNQSFLIADLKKQLKYFKSIIANSNDISRLIRNIHQSTGMSVSSSLDKNLSLKNICVPKLTLPVARKTAHPWEEPNYPSYPTPESSLSSPDALKEDEFSEILNDITLDFPIDIPEDELMDVFKDEALETEATKALSEHDYTSTIPDGDDVGVCLHVSKHRVSLEFCASCSENAAQSWLN